MKRENKKEGESDKNEASKNNEYLGILRENYTNFRWNVSLRRPENFTVTIRGVTPSIGAGFVVALTGAVMTMPGLPKSPAAERIDIDENGDIVGLF